MTDSRHTTVPLRKDAARNRRQILQAARDMRTEDLPVQLNAVAQRADVGVGTVYRHFPTPEALLEALVEEQFETLTIRAENSLAESDVPQALRSFLEVALTAYVQDEAFAAAVTEPHPVRAQTEILRGRLIEATGALVARAVDTGELRPGIDAGDLMLLLCGLAIAVRSSPRREDPALAPLYLGALLNGVVVTHDRESAPGR